MITKNLLFAKSHEWVKVVSNEAYIGISDFAQKSLGDVVYIELPEIDAEINQGDVFGASESVKAAQDIYLPISGTILEVNTSLEDAPELINEDSYTNWIVKIKISDTKELETLMNYTQYESFCKE